MEHPKTPWKFIVDFRLLSILLLIAVVPFLLGTWRLVSGSQQSFLESHGAGLAESADMAFNYLNDYIGNQIIEIAGLTEVPVLRTAIERKNLDLGGDLNAVRKEIIAVSEHWRSLDYQSPELRAILDNPASDFLRRYAAVRTAYREIIVTDFLGRTVAATGKTSEYHHANDDWWKEAYSDGQKGAIFIGDIHYHESAKTNSFDIAQPFVDPKGGVMGVIMVSIDAQAIHSLIGSMRASFEGRAALVRSDGTIVSSLGYSYLDNQSFPGIAELVDARKKGKRFYINQSEPRTIYGLNSRSLLELYPHLDWMLVISSPVERVANPLAGLVKNIVLLMLAVGLITLLAVLWLSRIESRPVLEEDAHLEQL